MVPICILSRPGLVPVGSGPLSHLVDIPDFPVRFRARQPLLESGHLHTRIVSSSWTVFDLSQLFQSIAQSEPGFHRGSER